MLNTWIRRLLLNLLKGIKPVEKLGGFVCDQCRVLTQYKQYYRINSNDFCSLQCYEDYRLRPVVVPKVKTVAKKKKGKKK
jgi:hypothetical protein